MALSFLAAFLWAVKRGQYYDTYTPSIRILLEDDASQKPDVKEEIKTTEKNKV